MLSIGVLVSGGGSNLQAIIDSIESKKLDAEIKVVISNKSGVYALERAKKHGIPSVVMPSAEFASREAYDAEAVRVLREHGVELVVLAGFLRLLTPVMIREFRLRIMNVHPSLLPAFTGLHVQEKAVEYGVKFSGCTVHFVDEGLDTGPIIIQAAVPVLDDDTAETLSKRILAEEHRIYPQAIRLYSEGRLTVSGRKVTVKDGPVAGGRLENPPVTIS